jgi:hypothetical protein
MPNNIVKSFAEKTNKSVEYVEKKWDEAKIKSEKEGHKNDYPYIVGILKNLLGINESVLSFQEFDMCDEIND